MRRPKLSDTGSRIRQTTWAFADGRLDDSAVLTWAVGLTADHDAERTSLRDLFDQRVNMISEPFALAWRCVFEYWQRPDVETNLDKYMIKRELKLGGTQREIIELIVELVRPWLKIDTSKHYHALSGEKLPNKPKLLKHLIWAKISSGDRLTPKDIGLEDISNRNFLVELGAALNASLLSGLNLARMIGSIADGVDSTNWQVHRVYYVPEAQFPPGGGEPDRHGEGFAPATKLMFSVLERLATIDVEASRRLVLSWDTSEWKLYRRLWAAAARNPHLAVPAEVSEFLETIDDEEFWWSSSYPEIAELRAVRWSEIPADRAPRLEARLLKGQPAKLIPKSVEAADRLGFKQHHTRVELQRIRAAGSMLSEKASKWLNDSNELLGDTPEVDLTYGFNQGVRLLRRDRSSKVALEAPPGPQLLGELANMIGDGGWDDRTELASDYIAQNPTDVLELLERAPDQTVSAKIWQAFGYGFRPLDLNVGPDKVKPEDKAKIPIAVRACKAIVRERPEVLKEAISGLASFMNSWDKLLRDGEEFLAAWLALWPIAVAATNEEPDLSQPLSERAFASPVGQLLFALSGWPTVKAGGTPLSEGPWADILSAIANTTGEARFDAQYILLRDVGYYHVAEPAWTTTNLIEPLKRALPGGVTFELWEGLASGDLPGAEVFSELAEPLVAAAISKHLSGRVRGDLSQQVIWSLLLSARDKQAPAVPFNLAQQMLRMGGDDVRREAIKAMHDFLENGKDVDINGRFELVASLFLEVWPKELTLNSRQVSESLAELPAAAGPRYAATADLVLPYLTPFDCWSLWDYGILDRNADDDKFSIIDDPAKASALLAILEKTIGSEEGAIIPNGLESALIHIAKLAPKLEKDIRFQRLLTLSRR
ncbi:hypothetical protein [Rhizobium rhizogenes]|uniref:hypothetical protein n=1 Tax=Rhizobium rhizogenes TaxID=359 RepID=UPI001574D4D6|nr:hypothetical protein [Rhizobium rhizogenes]NTF98209.1 hypothetical protein [Rhizobium rhizogenes]